MGLNTATWSVQDWLNAAPACGLPTANFVPASLRTGKETDVANNSIPPGAPSDFATVCQASLIARGIIYFKSNPGDCPVVTPLGITNAQLTGLAGQTAAGIASLAGTTLPGIGVAVSAIQAIFANHAQAVATEQEVICSVAGIVNQVFAFYDAAVAQGKLSPTTAYAGMQTYLAQVTGQLDAIKKGTCDAACVYIGILTAHATYVQWYYPQIAPPQLSPAAPGAAPVAPTTPGGVQQTATKIVPGTLIQAPNGGPVYLVNSSGQLEHVVDWPTVESITGTKSQQAAMAAVVQVSSAVIAAYPMGPQYPTVDAVAPPAAPAPLPPAKISFSTTDLLFIGGALALALGVAWYSSKET
jgi:hypothetical protein